MISVCIATYNGEKFIKEQLDSILSQLGSDDEVIISDDGSVDDTIAIIESYQDVRIVLYRNSFKNLILNFEFTLKHASGDFIFLSDQDDIWLPNKIQIIKDKLMIYDVVVSNCLVVDKDLKVLNPSFFSLNKSEKGLIQNVLRNSYLGCCMAFKRNILHLALPFPSKIPMHDVWLGLVSELFFKSYFLEEPLIMFRRHGGNESPTSEKSPYGFLKKIMFRMRLLGHIPKLYFKYYKLGLIQLFYFGVYSLLV